MNNFKIIHTDNYGGDYPDEKFVTELPCMTEEKANLVCDAINKGREDDRRYYKVVPSDYVLQPGFEP